MTHSGPPRTHTGAWVSVAILLLVAVLGTLIVPIYARSGPKLGSFPFFYWYQLLWVPVVALLTTVCYLITTRVARPAPDGGSGAAPAQPPGGQPPGGQPPGGQPPGGQPPGGQPLGDRGGAS